MKHNAGDILAQQLLAIMSGAPFSFEEMARRVFYFQYERCAPYRRYCDARGHAPSTVEDWRQIPMLPVTAFKHARIYCGTREPVRVFHSSGTTEGADRRASHYFERLDLYATSTRWLCRRYLCPDLDRIPMLILAHRPSQRPDSSLSWKLAQQEEAYGAAGGGWFIGPQGLRTAELERALGQATEPVALLGTAFAFVHLADGGFRAQLPPGSRLLETGGFKGKSRTLERGEFHDLMLRTFGPDVTLLSEYGMTEISTQYCSQTMLNDRPLMQGAPWIRIRILDPETLAELPAGRCGLIAITDLANLHSCSFLLTQDVGAMHPEGLDMRGRAPGAEARGCSLAMDEFLRVNRP